MGLPAKDLSGTQEAVIHYLINAYVDNKPLLRRLKNMEDELLTVVEVADLLKCSEAKLRALIKDGEWQMVKGPGGYSMTRAQFREQRDLFLAKAKRRR